MKLLAVSKWAIGVKSLFADSIAARAAIAPEALAAMLQALDAGSAGSDAVPPLFSAADLAPATPAAAGNAPALAAELAARTAAHGTFVAAASKAYAAVCGDIAIAKAMHEGSMTVIGTCGKECFEFWKGSVEGGVPDLAAGLRAQVQEAEAGGSLLAKHMANPASYTPYVPSLLMQAVSSQMSVDFDGAEGEAVEAAPQAPAQAAPLASPEAMVEEAPEEEEALANALLVDPAETPLVKVAPPAEAAAATGRQKNGRGLGGSASATPPLSDAASAGGNKGDKRRRTEAPPGKSTEPARPSAAAAR